MPHGFGRRLVPVSTFLAGFVLVALVIGIALFAFGAFVKHLRAEARYASAAANSVLLGATDSGDAAAVARAFAPRLIDPALLVVFVDAQRRVTVLRTTDASGRSDVAVIEKPRTDRSGEPGATGPLAHFALGLATIFGMPTERSHVSQLEYYVAVNQRVFVDDVAGYAHAFEIAVLLAMLLAVAAARLLTREALRPLEQVTAALERFASGDFSPGAVPAEGDGPLAQLAVAYNGAVAQVERSFAERARAQAQMRQFMSDAGHQLRTPLTVIRGFVSILRGSENASDPELAHMLQSMAQQTALMSSLIDKLILLEQWEHQEDRATPEIFDAGELIAESVTPLALAYPDRDLQIVAEIGTLAVGDTDDFKHALSNVVDNALKYTGGAVRVELTATESEICVSVRDRGPGLEPEQVSRVFDRFYRGQRRDVEGSGLGLAIAKRASERGGGRIDLDSSVERGTTVSLWFPRAQRPLATASDRR